MLKTKLFLTILFSTTYFVQSQYNNLNKLACAAMFSKEMHHIMDKTHQFVLEGKLTAYNTDSFHLTLSVNDYKTLNRHRNYDSTLPNCSNYNTIGFVEQTEL